MGLGALFQRNLKITTEDSLSGETAIHTVVTGTGAYPDWQARGAYRGGMGIPGASRAALLLSGLLGNAPWHAYTSDGTGITERVVPTPDLLAEPSPPDTSVVTMSSLGLDLIWHGNAIELIVGRDELGHATTTLPVATEFVHVRRVQPGDGIPFAVGTIAYHVSPYAIHDGGDPGAGRWYSAADVIHTKGPCRPGALRGMGVLENHLATLDLAVEQRRQAANVTGQGIPTGVLKSDNPDLTPTEAEAAKQSWMRAQRDRTVAVLGATTNFEALAWNPTEAQLLDARRFTLHEIALVFGIDPSWLGASQASRTYSNVEQEGIVLRTYSALADHLARIEAARSRELPAGMVARANLDAILRADTLGRYQAHALAFGKWLTDDEIRALEGRRPLTPEQRAQITAAAAGPAPAPGPEAGPPQDGVRSEVDLWMYWTTGKGKSRWATSREPLRALYDHLRKHFSAPRAGATALAWFPDGMGRPVGPGDGALPAEAGQVRRWNPADHPRGPDGKFGSKMSAEDVASDYRARVGELSDDEADAVGNYTAMDFALMNQHLRGTLDGEPPRRVPAEIATLSALAQRYATPAPMIAFRGLDMPSDNPMPEASMTGRILTDPGFVSVSVDRPAAGFDVKEVRLEIDVPAGTRGIAVNGTDEGHAEEREFILPPGSRMVVQSDETVAFGDGTQRRLKVIVLPGREAMLSYDDERDNR